MKKVLLQDLVDTTICGIYKLNYPNNKVYIGQSQNIYKRIQEHNNRAKVGSHGGHDIQVCEKAIQKYGPIIEFEILEECPLNELDNREEYWIKYYNSSSKEYGYNIVADGNVSNKRGVNHVNAAFSQEELDNIIDLLQNHLEITVKEIANQYNVDINTISRICTGKTYYNESLTYPLRDPNNNESVKKNKWQDYFDSEEDLIVLKEEIKWSWWLGLEEEIPKKYGIPRKIVYAIHTGKMFSEIGDYTYPLRLYNKPSRLNLTKEEVINLLNDLRNTKIPKTLLAEKYNMNRSTIDKINKGKSCPIKDYDYPAR